MSNYPNLQFFNEEWNEKDVKKDTTVKTGVDRRSSGTDSGKEQKEVQSKE